MSLSVNDMTRIIRASREVLGFDQFGRKKPERQVVKTTFGQIEPGTSFCCVDLVFTKIKPIISNGTTINAVRMCDGDFGVFADTDMVTLVNHCYTTKYVTEDKANENQFYHSH